eukprot:CAMPEP_0178908238 /NCGR_PEP_ID=MMETSP0786-20121207/7812_1 /TAXON_ID=186022 /ORGANISM="Thalassionema frauenfeldii, Strain CCMP 1798" /LENGTH=277 /DNA_ID=CAMNT_0020580119 /DNA_START=402 /DNA_END=1235 /DNA_ORIENTATION=+
MTLDEPSNSPARRQQYMVICSVMAGMFVYTLLTSGIIDSVKIVSGTFPGGTYMYKNSTRDYSAALGLMDDIGNSYNLSRSKYKDLLYTTYLDHPYQVGGSQQRFATGFLLQKKGEYEPLPTPQDRLKTDPSRLQQFQQQAFQFQDMPSVPASVATFPHSLGFVSALITSYKIIPALMNHAKEQHSSSSPVVWMTCDLNKKMCTFYAPHATTKTANQYNAFWLGDDDADTYLEKCSSGLDAVVDLEGVKSDFIWIVTYPYKLIFGSDDNTKKKDTDEL